MFKLNFVNILYFSGILIPIKADFEFKISYCEFKCTWGVCEADLESQEKEAEEKIKIPGFYWRDYHGVIPDDAFPLGPSTQSPRTFAGLVNDIKSNGTFATTIYEGFDYVYSAYNGTVHQLDDDIQILCTQEPDKMKWIHLTNQSLTNIVYVQAGAHAVGYKTISRYLARVSSCNLNYAGGIQNRADTLEYALIDGSVKTSTYFEILYYDKSLSGTTESTDKKEEKKQTNGGSSFFMHQYEYSINPNSIIPTFYKKIKTGPCSMVCTNKDKLNQGGHNKQGKSDISLDYFWMPYDFFSKTLALESGKDLSGNPLYTAQGWTYGLGRDVGETTKGRDAFLLWDKAVLPTNADVKTLSTTVPEKFIWVPSDSTKFNDINTTELIKGGTFLNGTKTYVGRVTDGNRVTTASIRVFDSGVYAFYYYYAPYVETTFDVLMHV